MSLAAVVITYAEFQSIWSHLTLKNPNYRCMHLRSKRTYGFRHLQTLYAVPHLAGADRVIEGMISGPDGFWHYRFVEHGGTVTTQVMAENPVNSQIQKFIAKRFVSAIESRIRSESKTRTGFGTNYTYGEYYLRRGVFGAGSSANAARAVSSGTLDARFVAQLSRWQFQLVRG